MKKRDNKISKIIAFLLLAYAIIFFLLPMLLVVSVSFMEEQEIINSGFKLIPEKFSLQGYELIFADPSTILTAYVVTALQAFLGTFISVLVMSMCAYPLSRKSFKLRNIIMFYIFFTMLFSGGMVPTYILNTRYLGLKNNFLIYILPGVVGAWYVIVLRTFFNQLPEALIDAAKIDGAKEMRIFFQIVVPLSKPVIASISLLILLDKWNDWMTSFLYITDEELFTLQYLLQRLLEKIEFVKSMAQEALGAGVDIATEDLPGENMRFAMSVVAAGPMMLIFPFFQKYFVKGLSVGSVKG